MMVFVPEGKGITGNFPVMPLFTACANIGSSCPLEAFFGTSPPEGKKFGFSLSIVMRARG